MRNDKLRAVFEGLGFENVKTVISSGNIVFESPSRSRQKLEETIEKALPEQLGFRSTTIVRSRAQLQQLVDKNPFEGLEHSQKTSLNVTFLKSRISTAIKSTSRVEDWDDQILGAYGDTICSVIDLTSGRTPDLMLKLEKKFGKEITTRTWKTVEKILKTMGK